MSINKDGNTLSQKEKEQVEEAVESRCLPRYYVWTGAFYKAMSTFLLKVVACMNIVVVICCQKLLEQKRVKPVWVA